MNDPARRGSQRLGQPARRCRNPATAGEQWWATIYAHVADVEQTLASAESHGGSRVYGPMAVDDRMQTGAFRDPAGNVFGVYHRAAG